jgi:hypothetical protein
MYKIKTFSDKQKVRKFVNIRSTLEKIMKSIQEEHYSRRKISNAGRNKEKKMQQV